jgi:hypothetical protein
MIWAKRRFAFADHRPYFERLENLLMSNAPLYRQLIMVSTDVDRDQPGVSEYYIGVPSEIFLAGWIRARRRKRPAEGDRHVAHSRREHS